MSDDFGALVNREEYTPYGETSFGSFAHKRYRFTGKERDEESGLNYHGARYYATWLARWTSCDPAGPVDGPSLYKYTSNRPLALVDRNGREGRDPPEPGPYKRIGGDHVHQVAPRTDAPGAKRTTAALYRDALSVSTKDSSYSDKSGQKVERAINRAAWGTDYDAKPAGPEGKVHLRASGDTAVGSTKGAKPSQWLEDVKSYYKLQEAGKDPYEALKLVSESRDQLQQAGATPKRVPEAPRAVARNFQAGQNLSGESDAATLLKSALLSKTPGRLTRAAGWLSERVPAALELVEKVTIVLGATNEAIHSAKEEHRNNPGWVTEGIAFTGTLLGGVAAGAFDTALALEPWTSPMVTNSWEQHGAGPTQHLVGEAMRALITVGR